MYCQKCGNELPITAKFCSNCGAKVRVVKEKVKKEKIEKVTVEKEVIEQPEETQKKTGKSKKKLLAIIAGVFVVLAVVVCSFLAYSENRTLYTLVNPELFFGECTEYVVAAPAPGGSVVVLFFESETDMWDEVINYVNIIDQIDTNLRALDDNDPRVAAGSRTEYSDTWHYYGDDGNP